MSIKLMVSVAAIGLAGVLVTPVQAATMKECAAQWQEAKKANTTGGKTYRDFSKECMSKDAAPSTDAKAAPATDTKAAPADSKPAATAATTTDDKKSTAKMSPGRQAMVERERACGAEWKADKAAGKLATGMTWPKYWSECNTRKKAAQ